MVVRKEVIGDATLYLGDCREIAPTLEGVDCVVTDPPYGMAHDTDSTRFSGGKRKHGDGRDDWGSIAGDSQPFDPSPWIGYQNVVIWGYQHFAQKVPVGTVLAWIKRSEKLYGTFLSDAELAWRKGGHGVYCYHKEFPPPSRTVEHDGNCVAHPTQKPVGLMEWCLGRAPGNLTLDPYMGSGTTMLACMNMGRPCIGIEIEPRYFDIACQRIDAASRQQRLFA